MRIILISERGPSTALRLSARALFACAALLIFLGGGAAFAVYRYAQPETLPPDTVAAWREKLELQQQEVAAMRERTTAEARAVGRQLAEMQARLLRMEALGARVTEVADLDDGEFSFDEPPPQGGPFAAGAPGAGSPADLKSELDELARGLKARESELEVLESMLRHQDLKQAREIAGRPVTWGWMSSKYGKRLDPFTGKSTWHAGVDFAGRDASEVIAVAGGVVTYAAKRYGYGLMVEITHGDGYVTRYGHHSALLVKLGDVVKKGQVIGKMGSSGRSTGPHVHFEVLKNGRHVDPARYVARRR